MMENTEDLDATGSNGEPSDLEEIVAIASSWGYVCAPQVMESSKQGVPNTRKRQYIVMWLFQCPATGLLPAEFKRKLRMLEIPQTIPFSAFDQPLHGKKAMSPWVREHLEKQKKADVVRVKKPARKRKYEAAIIEGETTAKVYEYEVDHQQAYQSVSLHWPPSFSPEFEAKTRHLVQRRKDKHSTTP